mgnify:CR=1 FL=1
MTGENEDFLETLGDLISARAADVDNPKSYTASLLRAGLPRIAQKVGEEGVELALAGVQDSDDAVLAEAADLLYHLLVLLEARQLRLADVVSVLRTRHTDT